MNAKVLDFVYTVLERVAREAYLVGRRDAEEKKPVREQAFKLSQANKLTIKTALEKHTKTR
ncbi:MAG: hypothetical protein DDT39_00025 [Firmicutes bacterium]|nr:hypothetical protein [candidate division NPL-UPA2 bacterium]